MDRFFNKSLIKQALLTPEMVQELLHYDPLTGAMSWKVSRGRVKAGGRAGKLCKQGYWVVRINYQEYLAHRLAWLMMTGEWPQDMIDHENGKRFDNRWQNLRASCNGHNQQNRTKTWSKVGLLGVVAKGKKFAAQIYVDGKGRHLGCFKTKEEAHMAYLAAKQIHHPHAFVAAH